VFRERLPVDAEVRPAERVAKPAEKFVQPDALADRADRLVDPGALDGHVAGTSNVDPDDERGPCFPDLDHDRAQEADGANGLRGVQLTEEGLSTSVGGAWPGEVSQRHPASLSLGERRGSPSGFRAGSPVRDERNLSDVRIALDEAHPVVPQPHLVPLGDLDDDVVTVRILPMNRRLPTSHAADVSLDLDEVVRLEVLGHDRS
jgi:hypothetical protein